VGCNFDLLEIFYFRQPVVDSTSLGEEIMLLHLFEMQDRERNANSSIGTSSESTWRKPSISNPSGKIILMY